MAEVILKDGSGNATTYAGVEAVSLLSSDGETQEIFISEHLLKEQEQADWAETDSNAASFIKNKPIIPVPVQVDWNSNIADDVRTIRNKPFGNLPDFINRQQRAFFELEDLDGCITLAPILPLEPNQEYIFTVNTAEYSAISREITVNDDTFVILGNSKLHKDLNSADAANDDTASFLIVYQKDLNQEFDNICSITLVGVPVDTYTISLRLKDNVKKIDPAWLPDDLISAAAAKTVVRYDFAVSGTPAVTTKASFGNVDFTFYKVSSDTPTIDLLPGASFTYNYYPAEQDDSTGIVDISKSLLLTDTAFVSQMFEGTDNNGNALFVIAYEPGDVTVNFLGTDTVVSVPEPGFYLPFDKVYDQFKFSLVCASKALPTVSDADNGKVLTVVNGNWSPTEPTDTFSITPLTLLNLSTYTLSKVEANKYHLDAILDKAVHPNIAHITSCQRCEVSFNGRIYSCVPIDITDTLSVDATRVIVNKVVLLTNYDHSFEIIIADYIDEASGYTPTYSIDIVFLSEDNNDSIDCTLSISSKEHSSSIPFILNDSQYTVLNEQVVSLVADDTGEIGAELLLDSDSYSLLMSDWSVAKVILNGQEYFLEKQNFSGTTFIGDIDFISVPIILAWRPEYANILYIAGAVAGNHTMSLSVIFVDALPSTKTSASRPDWQEEDENSPAFIKNKPFGNDIILVKNAVVTHNSTERAVSRRVYDLWKSTSKPLEVIWNGIYYKCESGVAYFDELASDVTYVGNSSLVQPGATDTGEPFFIGIVPYMSFSVLLVDCDNEDETEKTFSISIPGTIDSKYLPKDLPLLPTHTSDDEGKFLKIIDGSPAWCTIYNAEEVVL